MSEYYLAILRTVKMLLLHVVSDWLLNIIGRMPGVVWNNTQFDYSTPKKSSFDSVWTGRLESML